MGSGASKPTKTQEQEDIKYLGDRFPFGDDELLRLYRCYQAMGKNRVSFLVDLAVHCMPPIEDDDKKELLQRRRELLSVVESEILPPNFGSRLETIAFLTPQDVMNKEESCQEKEVSQKLAEQQHQEEEDDYTRMARLEKFFDGAATCGRRGGRAALGTLFQCCVIEKEGICDSSEHLVGGDGTEFVASVKSVLELAYRMALACAFLTSGDADYLVVNHAEILDVLTQSMLDYVKQKQSSPHGATTTEQEDPNLKLGIVTKMDFLEWSESHAPLLSSILPTFWHLLSFPDRPYPPSRTAFSYPQISSESAFFKRQASPLLFCFCSMSSALGGAWHRLYTSTSDGLSFNRLQNSLLGYSGPTLVIIQAAKSGGIFGAFTASSWKESKDFYGNSDCFLFQLQPKFAVYRPRGKNQNFMYCNSHARSRGYDGLAHGIGFGGTSEQPRLFIAESLDNCIAASQDLTFEPGPLLPRNDDGSLSRNFEILHLEVWGVGGDNVVSLALNARDRQRDIKAAHIQKARKVDKAAFLDDFQSGLIESKAFKHRDQIRGRADVDCDDRYELNRIK